MLRIIDVWNNMTNEKLKDKKIVKVDGQTHFGFKVAEDSVILDTQCGDGQTHTADEFYDTLFSYRPYYKILIKNKNGARLAKELKQLNNVLLIH